MEGTPPMSLFEDETGDKLIIIIIIIIIINGVIKSSFTLKSNFILVRKYVLKVYNIKKKYTDENRFHLIDNRLTNSQCYQIIKWYEGPEVEIQIRLKRFSDSSISSLIRS